MYKNNKNQEEQNFWISYADLMAGLLFVFVLLVGAIVVRYIYVQQDLAQKRDALGLSENALSDKNKKLQILKIRLQENVSKLAKNRREKDSLAEKLQMKNQDIGKLKDLILDYDRESDETKVKMTAIEANLSQNQNI
jgi:chemotaxis protein MotB